MKQTQVICSLIVTELKRKHSLIQIIGSILEIFSTMKETGK